MTAPPGFAKTVHVGGIARDTAVMVQDRTGLPAPHSSASRTSARAWNVGVAGVSAALVALIAATVLVVDPRETVSQDLGLLYPALGPDGWVDIAVLMAGWAAVVAALTAAALVLGHVGWRE